MFCLITQHFDLHTLITAQNVNLKHVNSRKPEKITQNTFYRMYFV